MSSTVLVPLDFSEISKLALSEARKLVNHTGDLHLVHVLAPLHPIAPAVVWETIDENARRRSVVEALEQTAREHGCEGAKVHVRTGDPGRQISELAEEIGADIVVIPTHGRTGFSRLLLGSVTERVIRLAPCSVLVVRTPEMQRLLEQG